MRRYLIPLILFLLAAPVVFSSHVDEAAAQAYRTTAVQWVELPEATRTGVLTFTTPENAQTPTILAAGRPLRILRAGDADADFTDGYYVATYTANTPAGHATVTLQGGPDIAAGAITVQWIKNPESVGALAELSVCAVGCDYTTLTGALASSTDGDIVRTIGDGTYTEDITIPDGVNVFADGVDLVGEITIGDESSIELHSQTVGAGEIGVSLTGANAVAYYEAERQTATGTGIGAVNLTSTAHLHYAVNTLTIENGFGVGSAVAGHVHVEVEHAEITGTGTMFAATTGGQLTGFAHHIVDGGAGQAFLLAGTGAANMTVNGIDCASAYNVASTARLRITNGSINAAATRTGLARVNDAYHLPSGLALATYAPADSSVVPVSAGDRLYDGNTGLELLARDIGGTVRWHGDRFQFSTVDPLITWNGSENIYYSVPYDLNASSIMLEGVSFLAASDGAAHDATDYYYFFMYFMGNTLGTIGDTKGLTSTPKTYIYAVNQIFTMPANGADPDVHNLQCRFRAVKTNAPADASVAMGTVICSYVYE